MIREKIEKTIETRAYNIIHSLSSNIYCDNFYMAGGCLASKNIHDIDIFPVINGDEIEIRNCNVITSSPNATTYDTNPWPVQVCKYWHPDLKTLVDSFDFVHIQIGVRVAKIPHSNIYQIEEIYLTDNFIVANATGSTWFAGSEYPLSSLIRAQKYQKYGIMSRGEYIRAVIDTLVAVIERGFKDYADFKNQLDAVDLGLLPEELEEVERGSLLSLFELLKRK